MLTSNSRFCGEDEEHDPSEDFEEYLACAVCGDNCKLQDNVDVFLELRIEREAKAWTFSFGDLPPEQLADTFPAL